MFFSFGRWTGAWQLLTDRCKFLASTVDTRELPDFLETLSSATFEAANEEAKQHLRRVTGEVRDIVRTRWNDSEQALTAEELDAYDQASVLLSPLPPTPNLAASWAGATRKFLDEIKWSKEHNYFFPDDVSSLMKLAKSIGKIEPRFLRQNEFPQNYRTHFEDVLQLARMEAEGELSDDNVEDLRSDNYRLSAVSDLVKEIYGVLPELNEGGASLVAKLTQKAVDADDFADDLEPGEPDYDSESDLPSDATLDMDSLFSDL